MDSDRPLNDDEFLAELAALDEVLRKPAEPARPPLPPPDLELTESFDLVLPSRDTEALSAPAAAPPPVSRRFAMRGPLIAALSSGLLVGGYLGWSLTRSPIEHDARAAAEAARGPFTASPGASRPAPPTTLPPAAPVASRAARGNVEASKADASKADALKTSASKAGALKAGALKADASTSTKATSTKAANTKAANTAAPGGTVGSDVSLPAASPRAGSIPSIPSAPAPSIDLPPAAAPLSAAPVAVAPSMPPAAPRAVAAAGALAAVVAADEAAIERTLRQYEDAYERLDAKAAVAVWPSVDQRALSRAFAGLASQTLDMRGCEVIVRAGASKATASCSGTAEYVRKVGDARVRVEPRQWTFTLNKTQGAWRIEAVDGSR